MTVLTKSGDSANLLQLSKDNGNANGLDQIKVGIGWNKAGDNDASILFLNQAKQVIAAVFPSTFNEALQNAGELQKYTNANAGNFAHTGDDRTGQSSEGGDDEMIVGSLSSLPADVAYASIVVNNFDGTPLAEFGELYARVVDESNQSELAKAIISDLANAGTVGVVVATLYRNNGNWQLVSTPVASIESADTNFTGMSEEAAQAVDLLPLAV
jgi:tellurium resistance protein TerZ